VRIAQLLRNAMVEMHKRGLSQKERTGKTNKLYEFITSIEYKNQFSQVQNLTDKLLDIDVEEKKLHDKTWRERGKLLIKQQHAERDRHKGGRYYRSSRRGGRVGGITAL